MNNTTDCKFWKGGLTVPGWLVMTDKINGVRITGDHKLLWAYIDFRRRMNTELWESIQTMADQLNKPRATVSKWIKPMKEAGILATYLPEGTKNRGYTRWVNLDPNTKLGTRGNTKSGTRVIPDMVHNNLGEELINKELNPTPTQNSQASIESNQKRFFVDQLPEKEFPNSIEAHKALVNLQLEDEPNIYTGSLTGDQWQHIELMLSDDDLEASGYPEQLVYFAHATRGHSVDSFSLWWLCKCESTFSGVITDYLKTQIP